MDENGSPLRVIITSGVTNDCTKADELQEGIEAEGVVADRAYDTNAIVDSALKAGMKVVIPSKKIRKEQREYDREIYRLRHLVENAFEILKRWRGIATRYAKHTKSFLAAVQIACIAGWSKTIAGSNPRKTVCFFQLSVVF